MNKPFLLKPAAKDYLWGGRRLKDEFAKEIDMTPLAETWECSTHPDGPSIVASGEFAGKTLKEVLRRHAGFLGTNVRTEGELPILIKFIDANKDLSVQVHPSDEYAREHENGQPGKTEMWYVLDAAKDARLVYGLKQSMTPEAFRNAVQTKEVENYLQKIPVKQDDLFFIEAGTIHAIGAGVLVAEIQENSNLTYRIYDYDRVDANGKKRETHLEKALEAAKLSAAEEPRQPLRVLKYKEGMASELLINCKYFQVSRMIVNTERRQKVTFRADELSFRVLLCIRGCGTIEFAQDGLEISAKEILRIYKGDCLFVPADSEIMTLHGQMTFLDVRA